MARGSSAVVPAAQLQTWLLQDTSENRKAARAGRQVLQITVKRQRPGTDIWEKFSDLDLKWRQAVDAAALTLPGEECDVRDTDGTLFRVMAF